MSAKTNMPRKNEPVLPPEPEPAASPAPHTSCARHFSGLVLVSTHMRFSPSLHQPQPVCALHASHVAKS